MAVVRSWVCGWSQNVIQVMVVLTKWSYKGKEPTVLFILLVLQQNHQEKVRSVLLLVWKQASWKLFIEMATSTYNRQAINYLCSVIHFSHLFICWHSSYLIHRWMDDIDPPLLKQPSKRTTFILTRKYLKDMPRVDGRKLQHFYSLPWMVYDLPWVQIIHAGVETPLNSYMGTWVRL